MIDRDETLAERTKRRVIGGLIMLVVVGIMLVWVLDTRESSQYFSWRKPIPPQFEKIEIAKNPQVPEDLAYAKEKLEELKNNVQETPQLSDIIDKVTPQAKNAAKTPSSKQPDNPLDEIVFNEDSLPTRWAVQVASFNDKKRAETMKSKLAQEGFNSVIRSRDNKIHALYLGPFLLLSKAEEGKKRIKEKRNIDGILRKWE